MTPPPASNEYGQPVGRPLPGWTPPPVPPRASLEGRVCRLDPLDPAAHAEELHAAFSSGGDGSDWTYLPYGPFPTAHSHRTWMDETCSGADPLFFAVVDRSTGKPVGVASYLRITPAAGAIEVGHIHYAAGVRRSPLATEAMYLMMRRAFELGYRRYEWKCDALNAGSRDAARRLGFSFEGIFRQATVYKGRSRDTAWFAAIDSEWPALRGALEQWLDPDNFDADGRQRSRLSDLTAPLVRGVW